MCISNSSELAADIEKMILTGGSAQLETSIL